MQSLWGRKKSEEPKETSVFSQGILWQVLVLKWLVHRRWKGKNKTNGEDKRVVSRDKSGLMEVVKKKKEEELRLKKKAKDGQNWTQESAPPLSLPFCLYKETLL